MSENGLKNDLRLWLRISSDKVDGEIEQCIGACLLDLSIAGVKKTDISDPLVKQAVKFYCKSHLGYDENSEKFSAAYEHLKAALSLSGDYNK